MQYVNVGVSETGNLGFIVVIIIPAICKEKASPLGAPDVCQTYGLSYSLLSLAVRLHILLIKSFNSSPRCILSQGYNLL